MKTPSSDVESLARDPTKRSACRSSALRPGYLGHVSPSRKQPAREAAAARPVKQGFRVTVSAERVELPNGTLLDLDIVRHPGAAAVVPFVSEHDVLLIRQYRHAAGGMILEVPAGKLDAGEAPAVGAARERAEEAGQRPGRLVARWTTPATDERITLFAAFDLTLVPRNPDDDELIEVLRVRSPRRCVWSGAASYRTRRARSRARCAAQGLLA
jgi:ADP-ribose pyrophosphatase